MKCKHTWEVGSVIFKKNIPKIKTTCLLCEKEIIVEFSNNYDIKCPENERKKNK